MRCHEKNTPIRIVLKDYNSARKSILVSKDINKIIVKNISVLFLLPIILLVLSYIIEGCNIQVGFIINISPAFLILSCLLWYFKIGDLEYYKIVLRYILKKPQLKYT